MIKTEVVIIGLNDLTQEVAALYPGKKILVIDERNSAEFSHVLDFKDDLLFGVYQSSLEVAQFESEDYEQMKEFYQMVVSMNETQKQDHRKAIRAKLEKQGIEVIKGRVQIENSQTLSVNYLEQDTTVSFESLVLNTESIEKKEDSNPFVFSLEELLATQLLPEEMIVEVSTLKDLEIAKMFSNFSTKVKVVMTKNVFTEIDHLMFRDSIKESMEESDFEFIDKASIQSIESQGSYGMVEIESVNDKVFPFKKESRKESFSVLLRSFEQVAHDFNFGLEKLAFYERASELIDSSSDVKSQSVYVTPAYVHLAKSLLSDDLKVIRVNADELHYFKLIHEINGGMEFMINKQTQLIESAIFYCYDSLVLRDIVRMLMDHQIPMSYFEKTSLGVSSVMSIFVEIAELFRAEV